MTATERLAHTATNITAYLRGGWTIPTHWVSELLVAYQDEKDSAEAWRRAYNQVADSYRALLASKPEVYLVDGYDAAHWARHCKLSDDTLQEYINEHAALNLRHETLGTQYLALRAKYDRLQRVATACEGELREIRLLDS